MPHSRVVVLRLSGVVRSIVGANNGTLGFEIIVVSIALSQNALPVSIIYCQTVF
jgi:hypothetical protein